MNKLFKALGDPTRREILDILKKGERSAGELGEYFEITAASMSHHLSILKNADLVDSTKKGQHVIYRLNSTVFQEIIEWLFKLKGGSDET